MNIRLAVLSCIPAVLLSTSSFAHTVPVSNRSFSTALARHNVMAAGRSVVAPGSQQSINPQPLPPKIGNVSGVKPGDAVSLNPQPLPPKIGSVYAVQSLRP